MESAARLRTVSVIDILFVFLIQASSSPAVSSEADKGSLQTVLPTNPGDHRLKLRTLSSFDLYRKHEDAMTPAGLAFQQCQWDSCVSWVSHQLLNRREPVAEFVRPPVYHPPQVKFPHHQPLRTWTDSETPRSPRAAFPRAGPPLKVLSSALAGRAGLILPVF
ncbi:hypothetical protein Q9233_014068 [Columba guinea]|nr:hypothetical protein Q9233_014068 [Columba guinea]